MHYRRFGTLHMDVSALGFGAMRLPIVDNDPAHVDEAEAIRMIRYAIDHGVTYVDTAYPYHKGTSEVVVGKALQEGYRERVSLATKMPTWLVTSPDDLDKYFSEQLERLQTDHIDFYLLHALNKERWPSMVDLKVCEWAEHQMEENRITYLGFSFHDNLEVFKEIVDSYDWTFCQIQYNYMDEHYQAGTEGLKYAASRNLGVVVMEPIRGGQLAADPPRPIQEIWERAPLTRTPADWALQWVWNHPEVSVVLSGMSTMTHVKENVASAEKSGPHTLTDEELRIIAEVRDMYRTLCPIPCTNCSYCLPCPNGVRIPRIFEIYNEAVMYNSPDRARRFYAFLKEGERADSCEQCGNCEEVCPQSIEIREWLSKVDRFFKEGGN
jgi:predicted aldo/keto reductase-like oxidoreductase